MNREAIIDSLSCALVEARSRIAALEAELQGLIWRADTVIARTHGGTGLAAQLDVERARAALIPAKEKP